MTSMRILGWKAKGLRCPDHEVDCTRDDGHPQRITLIQMPNGTGKTTTLTLLRAALSGAALLEKWDRKRINSFKKRQADIPDGSFEVRLLLNDRRVTIIMLFDFENGHVAYKTTRGDGQIEGFEPPSDLHRFMNINFVDFFVFDGELAESLLNRDNIQAESIIENLFQINSLKTISAKIGDYWEHKTRNTSATEEKGLTRRRNKLNAIKQRIHLLEERRTKISGQRDDLLIRLKKRQDLYEQEIKKQEQRAERFEEAKAKSDRLKAQVREEALEVLDLMRAPHALSPIFARAIHDLKIGLDRVKLPESAAREFFQELACEDECVCGRPISDEIKNVILERSRQYLGSDDVSLLNTMKSAIGDAVGQSLYEPERILGDRIMALDKTVSDRRDADNSLEQLRREAEGDPAVKKAKSEIDELEHKLSNLDGLLEQFDSKDDDLADERTFGIEILKKRKSDAEEKLAEITRTIELKIKRDILADITNNAYERARDLITSEVVTQANERIIDLMPFNRIAIQGIDRCLVLEGQEGGSAGETLSVAYAFLSTLFDRSDHQLPFVVDSPAGPIDLAVRPRIGEIIPKLTGQFIAFTISSEREGFVPRIKVSSSNDIKFLTIFRRNSDQLSDRARNVQGHVETSDGFIVPGESFFDAFQLETEEA